MDTVWTCPVLVLRLSLCDGQFTSFAWTDRLKRVGTRISMDGKGRFLDNIFVERLWRTLKYECVYPHAWETGSQARTGIGKWMNFYNRKRPHSALGGQPPAVVYWQRIEQQQPDQQMQKVASIPVKPVQQMGSRSDIWLFETGSHWIYKTELLTGNDICSGHNSTARHPGFI